MGIFMCKHQNGLMPDFNSGSSIDKRKDNSFWGSIIWTDTISNTNILKITGLVKYCPIFIRLNVVISLASL